MVIARSVASIVFVVGCATLVIGDASEDLQSPNEKARLRAVRTLAAAKTVDPKLTPALVERVREDSAPAVRWAAAVALGKVQPTQKLALAALTEVMSDKDEVIGVRRAAAESLGRLGTGSRRVADVLQRTGEDPALTADAVRALVALGAEDRAKRFLEHRDEKVRAAATTGYLSSGGADVLGVAFTSSDVNTRHAAAKSLLNRDFNRNAWKPAEITALQKAAGDMDPEIRYPVTVALTTLKETGPIVSILVEGLRSNNENVRWSSAEALAVAGRPVAKHLSDILAIIDTADSERMKLGLILALGEAGEDAKPALSKLFALLHDKTQVVRRTAMQALVKAGAADPASALQQAKALVNDPDLDIRTSAAAVIREFGTSATEIIGQLRSADTMTALNALSSVNRLGPDQATRLIPDMVAIVTRQPPPRKGVGGPNYASKIAQAIAGIGPSAVPAIFEGFRSPNAQIRQVYCSALVELKLDAAGAVADLRRGLTNKDADVRRSCATALGNLGYRAREAIPDLIKAMMTHDDISGAAGEAFDWIGGVSGDDAKKLIELAQAPAAPGIRMGRIMALGAAGKAALPVLIEIERGLSPTDRLLIGAVKDARQFANPARVLTNQLLAIRRDDNPHGPAALALRFELTAEQKKAVIAGLTERLEKLPAVTQIEILRCLGWMGPDAAEALPAVERLLAASDQSVRLAAKRAMKQIRP